MSGIWGYRGGGSQAWVQTDAFQRFLFYSGYGRLIAKGTFEEMTRSSDKHPHGAIAKLQPGDLIGYELKGDTDHFSVVVGKDANGYPLVNSHTADRYRVPFDLGWDQTTKYILIHVRD
ncbi:putative amidase domain protein [Paenibacillus sp. P1XP2]|nr:putative amidase domain protein [Paenibacillus sp. P1XP2]